MIKEKHLDNMVDDTWKKKGHKILPKKRDPIVCHKCKGQGIVFSPNDVYIECPYCQGLGEIE